MLHRKGMEMGVQTLIYIAIGVAILAVTLIIYFGVVSDGESSFRACENYGGECRAGVETTADCRAQGGSPHPLGRCTDEAVAGNVCCQFS